MLISKETTIKNYSPCLNDNSDTERYQSLFAFNDLHGLSHTWKAINT